MSETSAFEDLEIFTDKNSIENERSILLSRRIIGKIVDHLNLKQEFYFNGKLTGLKKQLLYKNQPIEIFPCVNDSILEKLNKHITIKVIDSKHFVFENKNGTPSKNNQFDEKNTFLGMGWRVRKTSYFDASYFGRTIEVNIIPREIAINKIKGSLKVEMEPSSTILNLSLVN